MSETTSFETYETWCLCKWLFNEEASHKLWRDTARQHLRDAAKAQNSDKFNWAIAREAKFNLARELSTSLIDAIPLPRSGAYWDLLNTTLSKIDWQAIAENFLEEIRQELHKSGMPATAETH